MKNIKTRFYILWFFTVITLWFTYAYSSVSSSLNYLRNAWDIGHIGYIITEMFGPDAKIKSAYLPDGMVVENASITQTWIVKLNNATGSTSEIEAPTINILTQVWTHLNDRIDNFPQYVHPTGDGNLHVPATSTSNNGKVLTAGSTEWSLSWQPLPSAPVSSVADKTGAVTLVKWDVGLSNVDNTSDANKPVSTATQTALDLKANIVSPTFTWTPQAPKPNADTNNTQIPTTEWVNDRVSAVSAAATGGWWCYYTNSMSCLIWYVRAPGVYSPFSWSNQNICCPLSGSNVCGSLSPGAWCQGNTIYAFYVNGEHFMTTPGNCDNRSAPFCDWWTDSLLKLWKITNTATLNASNQSDWRLNTGTFDANHPASKYCQDMVYGGFDDWFLPAYSQLGYMYPNKASIWGFSNNPYWSSSEDFTTNYYARYLSFNDASSGAIDKVSNYRIRCIRKF